MRCKNCGWPNKPSEMKCVKCNSLLSSDEEGMDNGHGDGIPEPSRPLNKTVLENDVFSITDAENTTQSNINKTRVDSAESLAQCPKCGYPLRVGTDKCPNCKFQTSHSRQSDNSNNENRDIRENVHLRPTRVATGNSTTGNYRGTINPYMMSVETEPTFVLKPIKRMEERHDFDELEYEGKQVVLNRDNTEQNNPSITSKQQAVITNTDGRWFIEDKSEQKTTFVQAAQKIELHDGDIILLGNRLFEFRK